MTDVKINLSQPILTNLLHHSAAMAVIVISGDQVAATAGPLSDSGVQVLTSAMARHWPVSIERDLTRYIGLSVDNVFRFLSVKFLPESDQRLGLVFSLQTPLSQIRQDLSSFMQGILDQDQIEHVAPKGLEQSLQFMLKDFPVPDPDHLSRPVPQAEHVKSEKTTEHINGAALTEDHAVQGDTQPTLVANETRSSTNDTNVLADEPIQSVEGAVETDLSMEDIPWHSLEDLMPSEEEISEDRSTEAPFEEEQYEPEARKSAWQTLDEQEQEEDDLVSILQHDFENVKDLTPADDIVLPLEDLPDPGVTELPEFEDESDVTFTDEPEPVEWESVLADITFYLVPRLKRHFILGQLPHDLRRWVPEICETYSWQLDALSVRPDYLKWTLRDFPETLVREMLRIIRRETSQRIFEEFPNLQHGNPTEDFWSQSYLVDRENLEISTQALIAHVAKERLSG